MLTRYKKGNPRASPKEIDRGWLTADPPAPLGKPDPPRKDQLHFTLRDLDMQIQGCQKATRRVCKMKPSAMHRQSHVIRIIVTWLSHASTSQ